MGDVSSDEDAWEADRALFEKISMDPTPEPSEPIVETYSHIPFAAVRISAEVEASGGGSEGGETRAGADAGAGGAEDTPTSRAMPARLRRPSAALRL